MNGPYCREDACQAADYMERIVTLTAERDRARTQYANALASALADGLEELRDRHLLDIFKTENADLIQRLIRRLA